MTRYDEDKAVLLSAEDFERLAALDEALDDIVLGDRLPPHRARKQGAPAGGRAGRSSRGPELLEALLRA